MGRVKEAALNLAYQLADLYCEKNQLPKSGDAYHEIVNEAFGVITGAPEADSEWDTEWVYEWKKENLKGWR